MVIHFLKTKKGKLLWTSKLAVILFLYIKGVDYVIPFDIENDQTVCVALEKIKPHVFTKGGDRIDEKSIPEWSICQTNDIEVISGVGHKKTGVTQTFSTSGVNFGKERIVRLLPC